jgi:hypothetical protein
MRHDHQLREHLANLLGGGHAHLGFDKAVADLPIVLYGAKHRDLVHTPWRLLEHMRIAQWDIVQFCIDPKHVSPDFPSGYWPQGDAPQDATEWDRSVAAFHADLNADFRGGLFPHTSLRKGLCFQCLAHPAVSRLGGAPCRLFCGATRERDAFCLIPKVQASSALACGCFFDMASRRREVPKTT